jgi:hypothetical protein
MNGEKDMVVGRTVGVTDVAGEALVGAVMMMEMSRS